jgi:hypothetical protein
MGEILLRGSRLYRFRFGIRSNMEDTSMPAKRNLPAATLAILPTVMALCLSACGGDDSINSQSTG